MIAADVIVMATPVYFYTMSGQMMERTMDGFRGFLDCLDDPKEMGVMGKRVTAIKER